jgi:hypothetical protein
MVSFLSWLGVAAAVVGGLVVAAYLFWPSRED